MCCHVNWCNICLLEGPEQKVVVGDQRITVVNFPRAMKTINAQIKKHSVYKQNILKKITPKRIMIQLLKPLRKRKS